MNDLGDEIPVESADEEPQTAAGAAEQSVPAPADSAAQSASHPAAGSADAGQTAADANDSAAAAMADGQASGAKPGAVGADAGSDESQSDGKATGSASANGADGAEGAEGGLTPLGQAKKEAADYLAALQRERADFVNYRNRTAKEKDQYRAFGVQDVLKALLPALDDLDRIKEHGRMTDDLAAVQKQLDRVFAKFDVTKFGEKGEDFDPAKHEAILHRPDPTATKATIDAVVESGYKIGSRVVRAARVVVVSPEGADSADAVPSPDGAEMTPED